MIWGDSPGFTKREHMQYIILLIILASFNNDIYQLAQIKTKDVDVTSWAIVIASIVGYLLMQARRR